MKILTWLFKNSAKPEETLFCMEHTGIYSQRLSTFFYKKSLNFGLDSPLPMKRSMGFIRGKNDKADACFIARYCYSNREEIICSKPCMPVLAKIKKLLSERQRLVSLKGFCKAHITEKNFHNVKQTLKRNRRLVDIYGSQISEIEAEVTALISSDRQVYKNYQLLRSVIGIGPITAALILAYKDNFIKIFEARKFAAYCCVAPYQHTSGSSIKGETRVSQMANKKIKGALSNGARAAIKHDPELKKHFERKIDEGKEYGVVLNGVKFKMLTRAFATVKRGTPHVTLRIAG